MNEEIADENSAFCPEILFHYTSIETLALILSSKTIRFNRLDLVNDVDEALSPDYPSAQTLVFASCWTATEADEIALWKLYSEFSGVRIALPTNMFAGRKEPTKRPGSPFSISVEQLDPTGALLPISVYRQGSTFPFLTWHVYGPTVSVISTTIMI